jgi:endonuclease-3 related protein
MLQTVLQDEDKHANREYTRAVLMAIYEALSAHYGPQQWWPTRSGSAWEIMLGAVLTQRTTWRNVDLALHNLERVWGERGLSDPAAVLAASQEELAELTRPTGHYRSKPRKLLALAQFVLEYGGVEELIRSSEATEILRERLLGIWGIGPETADAILLYALNRPVFVADAYALRLAARWGLLRPNATYTEIQRLFVENLPRDVALFNEYHALIVTHGKELCRPRPLCEACPLNRNLRLDVTLRAANSWRCPWPLAKGAGVGDL